MGAESTTPVRAYTLDIRPWRHYSTSWERIISHSYEGSGTEEDPYVVDWIDDDDRENPLKWSSAYQWTVTWLVAWTTLAASFASSSYSAAIQSVKQDFPGYPSQVYIMGISAFVLGYAFGPLLWAPMSEVLGRRRLFVITYTLFTVFNAAVCASQNIWTLTILRFLAGSFGASPLTNAAGVIGDIFPAEKRGIGMAIFSAAPFTGPTLGPIIGGFLGEAAGWRWVCGVNAILSGVLTILGTLAIPETYAPVLLRERANKLNLVSRLTHGEGTVYRSIYEKGRHVEIGKLFRTSLVRPWAFLFKEFLSFCLALYLSIVYGTLYMFFASFPIVYGEERGWSEGVSGLSFLGLLVGTTLGSSYYIFYDNPRYISMLHRHREHNPDTPLPPESRLAPAMLGAVLLPLGLFWFAWTCQPSVHWIVSILGNIPFGMGLVMIFLGFFAEKTYIADVYTIHAASALAANSVLRSLFGVAFPLFTTAMYNDLGINWASTLVAFLSLAMTPQPFLFYKYGPSIRLRSKYSSHTADIRV